MGHQEVGTDAILALAGAMSGRAGTGPFPEDEEGLLAREGAFQVWDFLWRMRCLTTVDDS